MTIYKKGLFGAFASIVSARNRQLDKTPDILVESPFLDSQLLKLKIEKDPVAFISEVYDNDSILEQIQENLSEELDHEPTSEEVEERFQEMGDR
jgi:glycine cleavage system H lipoate-binding protein